MAKDAPDLAACIHEELHAQNVVRKLGLSDKQIDHLANMIAGQIEYNFKVQYDPGWKANVGPDYPN